MSLLIKLVCLLALLCIVASTPVTPPRKSLITSGYTPLSRAHTTVARAVAILIIMTLHCSSGWENARLLTPLAGSAVSAFIVVSGYGLNESFRRSGLSHFWIKRIARVYIPYLLMVCVVAAYRGASWAEWAEMLVLLRQPFWFVTYIIGCYVAFWLTARFCGRYRMPLLLIASAASFFLLPEIEAEQSLGFVTGVWMSEHKPWTAQFARGRRSIALLAALFIAGLAFLAVKQLPAVRESTGTWVYHGAQLLIKWPWGLALLLVTGKMRFLARLSMLGLVGAMSYELFLTHFPFYPLIGNRLWPALLLMAASFPAAYVLSKLSGWLSDRLLAAFSVKTGGERKK